MAPTSDLRLPERVLLIKLRLPRLGLVITKEDSHCPRVLQSTHQQSSDTGLQCKSVLGREAKDVLSHKHDGPSGVAFVGLGLDYGACLDRC